MSKRNKTATLLAGVILASALSLTAAAADYSDVSGHWANSAITRWSDYGIIQGANGEFNPNGSMTRAQMATVLVNLLGLTDEGAATFSDVPATMWYASAIKKCATAGILNGSNGKASPDGVITRQEAAVMLCRALSIPESSGATAFADNAQISTWALGAVKSMSDRGIITGSNGSFAPTANINRASVVTIMNNAITTYAHTAGEAVTAAGAGITLIAAPNVTVTGTSSKGVLISKGASAGTTTLQGMTITGGVTMIAGGKTAVTGTSTINEFIIDAGAANAQLTVASGATVTTVSTKAPGAIISGDGTVKTVLASGANTAVNTTGTTVTATAAGVTANGVAVSQNATATTTNPTTSVVAAPIIDESRKYTMKNVVNTYSVDTKKQTGDDFTTATITATALKRHQNTSSSSSMGYWTGISLKAPANADSGRTTYSTSQTKFMSAGTAVGKTRFDSITKQDGTAVSGDYLSFYTDRAVQSKTYLTIDWRDANGNQLYTDRYLIDTSAVKTDASSALSLRTDLSTSVITGSSDQKKRVAALGLSTSIDSSTITVSGSTSYELLAASNGGSTGGNGYMLVSVNIPDANVRKVRVASSSDSTATYTTSDYSSKDSSLENAFFLPAKIFNGSSFLTSITYTLEMQDTNGNKLDSVDITVKAGSCSVTGTAATINITSQPFGTTVNVGDSAALSITASTTSGTLAYQWYSNTSSSNSGGFAISGATSRIYTVPTANVGITYYYCVVSSSDSSLGNVISNTAMVDVKAKAVVESALTGASVSSPGSATLDSKGGSVSLSATAAPSFSGVAPTSGVSYQWGGSLSGNGATATVSVPVAANTGTTDRTETISYTCAITYNGVTKNASGSMTVTVTAPVIETPPVETPPVEKPGDGTGETPTP